MSGRVLVVDDLIPNIKLLEAKLNAEYYVVSTAKSGKEALDFLENNQVDIILLDVMMPEMDGFEVCKLIKTNPKTSHIPVIMVTALSEVEDRVTGLKSGADDFLTKPINDVILMARLKSLLRLKSIIDEIRIRSESLNQLGVDQNLVKLDFNCLNGARVLLVDDDVAQRNNVAKNLSEQKAIVNCLDDEPQVIEELKKTPYDVIMISSQLLKIDSLRLCSHIRSMKEFRHIPILLLVEEDEATTLAKGLEIGANDYLVTPIDITELITRTNTQVKKKRYQDELVATMQDNATAAVKDALTGIFNRRYFDIHVRKIFDTSLAANNPLVLGVCDIDFFKKVNDTYGHVAGDEVIKAFAKVISETIRLTDLVARFGGEEFVFVLPLTTLQDAIVVAERIRMKVDELDVVSPGDQRTIEVTASIGITIIHPTDTLQSMLDRADQALYRAKQSGRNRVEFNE